MRLKVLTAFAALILCGQAPSAARALSVQASLHASFTPDRLGAPTTIQFGFALSTSEGAAPPPLTALDLHMPAGMNYTITTLGLATCQPAALLARGLAGCSPNSRIGYGSAFVEVPFGLGSGREIPEIQALSGPSPKGNLTVLFYANGSFPVSAQLVFSGEVLPDSGRFGSQLAATVPPVSSVPGGPNVSILSVKAAMGPSGLVYYKRVNGRRVAFRPRGVAVPELCPRGGFPFLAEFTFQDGSRASAQAAVPCPPRRRR